ncbi:MAG: BMP family ABC transporter substrate-binding protein [Geothrix sp.]|nr:BMP family ABC transporter substrate-binding protein [Geothrix sp.]
MNHRKLALATLGGAALLASTPLMGAPPAAAPIKIGYVYVSPVGDAGWTFQHDQGRKQMEAALQGAVTTKFIENVPEGADAERIIRQLAQDGNQIIFTTSFGYMNQTAKVAAAFPNAIFLHATGYKQGKNLGTYNARFYEGRYLNGVIAGKMTKTNIAGYVGAFPIPEVMQGINAFTRGMKSVNPKAEVRVIWVNSWFDPGKEREAAMTLISQGADMITHHTDSTAAVQAAEEKHKEKGTWAFSYHSDMAKYGPTAQLTGTTHIWGDFYTKVVKEVLDKKWKGTHVWGGFKDGMIKLAPLSPAIPADLKKTILRMEADITAGRLHPFAGPVVDQDGKERVPKGQNMTDADMGAMNYYVQGVASTLPKS